MSYELGPADPEGRSGLYAEPRDDEPPRRQRRVLAIFVALVVMGLFAGGLWLAYSQGARHSAGPALAGADVPLIRADPRPTRVKPEEPGGMQIPDRDKLIYAQTRSAQIRPAVEHLLPPPEKPMPRPTAPPAPAVAAPAPAPAPVAEGAAAIPVPPPKPPAPVAEAAAATPVAPLKPPQAAAASVEKAPPAEKAPSGEKAPSAAPKPPPERSKAASAGGARIQLGSVRSQDQARQEWDRIKHKNADLLGDLAATPIRADLGDKGVYYRIQAGPVGDSARAERLCGELRQRSVGCIIVR